MCADEEQDLQFHCNCVMKNYIKVIVHEELKIYSSMKRLLEDFDKFS